LLHISELADHKIDKPQDVVKPGDDVEVKILKVDPEARKIGLSLRRVQWAAAAAPAEEHAAPAPAPKKASKYQVSSPQVDAGGDTLRVKEALQRRAQAKAAEESQPPQEPQPAPEPKPEEGQAGG
jgi:small subunit ribosomal protein S1